MRGNKNMPFYGSTSSWLKVISATIATGRKTMNTSSYQLKNSKSKKFMKRKDTITQELHSHTYKNNPQWKRTIQTKYILIQSYHLIKQFQLYYKSKTFKGHHRETTIMDNNRKSMPSINTIPH